MGFLAGAAPLSPEAASSSSQSPALSLAGMTAHVSSALGQYCRIVVGDARFRADVLARVSVVVLRWMAGRTSSVALYGRRAWNAHIAQTCLVDATTDFDIMVLRPHDFHTLRFSLLTALRSSCPDLSAFIYAYVKSHLDSRGSTMTVEVGGTPLVDLTVRERYGDFCIGVEPHSLPEPYIVSRTVECPAGSAHPIVSVMRRHTMFRMLRAEIRAGIWRTERATRDLERYALYETMGWFHADDESCSEGGAEAVVVSVVGDAFGMTHDVTRSCAVKGSDERGAAQHELRCERAAQHEPRAEGAAQHEPRAEGAAQHEPRAEEAAQHEPRAEEAAQHEPRAESAGQHESRCRDEGEISETLSGAKATVAGEPLLAEMSFVPVIAPSLTTMLPTDVQLKLLKRHLYQAKSVEEARGCARFFAYQEDDPVCCVIREVLAAAHLGAVYRVAHSIE
jgi:hypothetical protein